MIRKYWKYLRFIVIPFTLFLLCAIIFTATDVFSMGVLAEWFDKMFLYEFTTTTENDEIMIVRDVNWNQIKTFIYESIVTFIIFGSWIVIVAVDIIRQSERRKHSHTVSEYMRRFLLEEESVPIEIPQENAEIISKISEVRLKMKEQETRLRKESQQKNDLITYLAHDLKTPMTSVIGYLMLLNDEPDLTKEQRTKYTGIAVKKAQRLEELMEEIFEITRFNLSKIELQKIKTNISRMLEQLISEFEPMLTEKSLLIKSDIENDIFCECDVDKMERIIDNLIRNAVSYSYVHSIIYISLKRSGNNVIMNFENKGLTIPKEKLNRIFEQFYRVDYSRSSSTGGSGLGLAIAKQFTEAHNGTLTAESENEKIVFTLTIPVF